MTEAFSLVKEKFKNREATICPLEADAPAATEEWQFFVDPYPTQAWPSDTYIIKVKVGDIVSDVRKLKI